MSEGVHILFHFNIVLETQRDVLYQDDHVAVSIMFGGESKNAVIVTMIILTMTTPTPPPPPPTHPPTITVI